MLKYGTKYKIKAHADRDFIVVPNKKDTDSKYCIWCEVYINGHRAKPFDGEYLISSLIES